LHHEPEMGDQQGLTPLAADHIANVLERELWPNDEGMMVRPIINTPFLNQLGLLQRLPVWRASLANRRAVDPDNGAEPSEQTELPARSEAPREQSKSSPFDADLFPWKWVWAGAAGLMVLLAVWFRPRPDLNQAEPAYARTPTPQQQPSASIASATAPTPVTAPAGASSQASQAAPLIPIWESPVAPPTETASTTVTSQAAAAPMAVATAQATNSLPVKKPQPDFRLQGIIYSSTSPSAIVNGQRVSAGDQVDGATVAGIGRTTVTLLIKGERKTFQLR